VDRVPQVLAAEVTVRTALDVLGRDGVGAGSELLDARELAPGGRHGTPAVGGRRDRPAAGPGALRGDVLDGVRELLARHDASGIDPREELALLVAEVDPLLYQDAGDARHQKECRLYSQRRSVALAGRFVLAAGRAWAKGIVYCSETSATDFAASSPLDSLVVAFWRSCAARIVARCTSSGTTGQPNVPVTVTSKRGTVAPRARIVSQFAVKPISPESCRCLGRRM